MIDIERLKADRRRGTDGPWNWGRDPYGFPAHLEPGVLGTDGYEPLNMGVADADRIARLPELEAAYIEAAKLLEEAKWYVPHKLFDAIEDLIGRSD